MNVTITDESLKNAKLVSVYYEGKNGRELVAKDLKPVDGKVTFAAEHFSVYVVVDQGQDARVKVVFMNGSSEIASMYVKQSDTTDANVLAQVLYDPSSKLNLSDGVIFKGWTTDPDYHFTPITTGEGDDQTTIPATTTQTIGQIRTGFTNGSALPEGKTWATIVDADSEGGVVVTYYAALAKQYNINYLDKSGASLGQDQVVFRADDTSEWQSYTITMSYTPEDDEHSFAGWYGNPNIQGYTETTLYQPDQTINIKGDVDFSVDTPEGHWLVFDENGKGATYNAPQFVEAGHVTTEPVLEMVRNGYTFGGWYTDEDCTDGNEFEFGHELTEKTIIYAKWTAKTPSSYMVIIWRQNIAGDGYDFEEAITLSGTTGTTISTVVRVGEGDNAYARVNNANKQYTGFHLAEFDENITIAPEDNAVVNVYYDRNEYTLTFKAENASSGLETRTKTYNGTTYTIGRMGNGNNRTYYIQINNKWYQITSDNNIGNYLWDNSYYIKSNNGHTTNITPGGTIWTQYGSNTNNYTWRSFSIASSETTIEDTSVYKTITALYQQPIGDNFPITSNGASAEWRWSPQNSTTFSNVLVYIDIMPAENVTFYPSTSSASTKYMEFYVEALPGQTPDRTFNGKSFVKYGNTITAKYNYFTEAEDFLALTGYEKYGSDPAFSNGRADVSSGGTIRFYYTRKAYTINFLDGAYVDGNNNPILDQPSLPQIHEEDDISYQADISSFNNYKPATAPAGYVFECWCLDAAGKKPYTFTTMPEGGITVYAKWRQIQYRVFLHPNAGTDPTLDWGSESQAMNFRISYNGKVSAPTGNRKGYIFIGWYSDESLSHMFKADTFILNDTTVTTPYDKTTHFTDVMDKWGNGATTNSDITGWDDDGNTATPGKDRFWITRELNLYAKWSKTLDGATGIGVLYNLTDPDAGTGSGQAADTNLYQDNVDATAVAGVTAPTGYVFDYWVMQKWNGTAYEDIAGSVIYAGQSYTVLEENAHKVQTGEYVKDDQGNYLDENGNITTDPSKYVEICTYTIQLRAEYKPVEEATPTHIRWYKNDGSDFFHEDKTDGTLEINEAVDIQAAPSRNGYIFLGWATVPISTSTSPTEAAQQAATWEATEGNWTQNLTADDLLVKYDTSGSSPVFTIVGGEHAGETATKVAADEALPYHAMFAVWAPIVTVEVTGDTTEATYDGQPHTATYSVTYKKGDEALESLTGTGVTATEELTDNTAGSTISGKNLSATNAGTYTATASVYLNASGTEITVGDTTYIVTAEGYAIVKQIGDPKPADATGTVTVIINPAEITIKADNKTKVYDNDATTDPELTATVTGAIDG